MRLFTAAALAAAALAVAAPAVHASIVDIGFDGFTSNIGRLDSGTEDGFDLTGPVALGPLAVLYTGFSTPNYIGGLNDQNWVLSIKETDGSAFSFVSLAGVNAQGSTGSLVVRGYQGASLVKTDTFSVINNNQTAQTLSASLLAGLALTRIEIEGEVKNQVGNVSSISILVDNLRLETDATVPAPVPLPVGAWLMLSAVGVFGALSRRKRAA